MSEYMDKVNTLPVGTPDWCYAAANLMAELGTEIGYLNVRVGELENAALSPAPVTPGEGREFAWVEETDTMLLCRFGDSEPKNLRFDEMNAHQLAEQVNSALPAWLAANGYRRVPSVPEGEDEKALRIRYQDIVYKACNAIDTALGRSVCNGTGTTIDTLVESIRQLAASDSPAKSNPEKSGFAEGPAHELALVERVWKEKPKAWPKKDEGRELIWHPGSELLKKPGWYLRAYDGASTCCSETHAAAILTASFVEWLVERADQKMVSMWRHQERYVIHSPQSETNAGTTLLSALAEAVLGTEEKEG